jgi:hypothetical protein
MDANDDHSWQIRGSRLLEMPSSPTIPQSVIGSWTSLQKCSVSLDDVIQCLSGHRPPGVLRLPGPV